MLVSTSRVLFSMFNAELFSGWSAVMRTFSRRARKAQGLFEPDQPTSQPEAPSQEDQEDPYLLPETLPAPSPILRQASPLANKPGPADRASAGISGQSNKRRSTAEPARSGGRGSGRSTGTLRGAGSKPAAAEDKGAAAASKSGRLLGAHRSKSAPASPSLKRKASGPDSADEGNAPSKKPRAVATAKPAALTLAVPLAAGPPGSAAAAASAVVAPVPAAPLVAAAALPVAMARLLNPAALRDSAPAQTVMEAQELGEQSRYRDDAMWALDGLCMPGSANTRRESVVALLDICATRRGRLALRSGGMAEEVLATLGKSRFSEDAVLALGAAAILACFCQADADPGLLAKEDTAQLVATLLRVEETVPEGSVPASFSGRILKVLREGPFARLLPQEEATSPTSVVLAAVAGVLDPNQRCVNVDPCKHALRTAGALRWVAQLAADHSHAVSDVAPSMRTVHALWKLNKSLAVLENACFACPENEAHLAAVTVRLGISGDRPASGGGGGGRELGLAEWLVRQVELLGQQGLSGGFKKDCLRALLAVLMNMTQNNAVGCEAVVAAGALEAATPLLAQIAQGGPRNKGCIHDTAELEAWVDELSCCLGLLINLMEHQPTWRQHLRQLAIPPCPGSAGASGSSQRRHGGGSSGGAGAEQMGLVPLLCALLTSVIPPSCSSTSPITRRLSSLSTDEITVETLEAGKEGGGGAGAASIVEVYVAILLGFLVEGCAAARAAAAQLLPTRSLEPVAAAVRRCLHFYVSAGAMTKGNEESLRQLLASLEAEAEGAGEGQGPPGRRKAMGSAALAAAAPRG